MVRSCSTGSPRTINPPTAPQPKPSTESCIPVRPKTRNCIAVPPAELQIMQCRTPAAQLQHLSRGDWPSLFDFRPSDCGQRNWWQSSSAVQTSVEECPGQQSLQPPAARMEVCPRPEWPPEQAPARATTAGPT